MILKKKSSINFFFLLFFDDNKINKQKDVIFQLDVLINTFKHFSISLLADKLFKKNEMASLTNVYAFISFNLSLSFLVKNFIADLNILNLILKLFCSFSSSSLLTSFIELK